ncbi:MAG TPA: hypothetical protein VHW68_06135 [Actinomycetota bacterium]|jgi:hypothetical protein|nr:hypothetical protein [Actinomycetota bacterium]
MDEFAALAQRVVLTMDDVRGCLVLSRDGLVLGAFPEDQEAELKPAWLRFVHVGEARKGFVEFSDQLWAFVHRGPYAAFVVTGTSVRPGVMLDQLEQAVIAAEETRAKQKEVTLKVPDAASAPSGRPRTSLHPPADRPATAPVGVNAAAEEMPSFAAPTGPGEDGGAAPDLSGVEPDQLQQMQAMQEQMAAMQAQLQQAQALQQTPVAPAPTESAPVRSPATQPPAAQPAAATQPLSGYRRPGSATPPPAAEPAPSEPSPSEPLSSEPPPIEQPRAELGGARPSIEGSPYESVLSDEQPAPFGAESSPFARLEAEQAQAAAERIESPSSEGRADPDASTFRTEPQRLVSPDPAPPASEEQEEPGEVDRVMLAKEFSGLLQLDGDGDED